MKAGLLPDSPAAQNDLAWYCVRVEQPQKGLAPALRAVRLMPGNASILNTLAALFFQSERCREARTPVHRGRSRGCHERSMLHEEGRGVERDMEKARALKKKACEGGVRSHCASR
ncbi:hypothetical protein OV207_25210 [Corallococcus sp. BB11-1]|uniref:SEL1-like repeat protein n=1 Tax=Corallococcus sp. BB11-1 TaxID=2996783 RepID=UPI00226DB753|nr:hypothetical protein [Corallococcus sp. BB11-1]MCY1034773.1 hypothetical protein [Corallococcus sp. BB11-1]